MRAFISIVLLLSVSAVACTTSWQARTGPVPEVLAAHSGRTVRVVRYSDVSVVLHRVELVGDSVIGEAGNPPQRTAIALTDVRLISVPETDSSLAQTGIKTVGVVLVALLAVTAIAIVEFADIFEFQ